MSNHEIENGAIVKVLGEHESLLGSDDYTHCVCGARTVNLGGLREHVAGELRAAVAPIVTADAMITAADLAETCETGTHAAQVIRFTARSLSRAPTTQPATTDGGASC